MELQLPRIKPVQPILNLGTPARTKGFESLITATDLCLNSTATAPEYVFFPSSSILLLQSEISLSLVPNYDYSGFQPGTNVIKADFTVSYSYEHVFHSYV